MNAKVEQSTGNSGADIAKLSLAVLLVIAGLLVGLLVFTSGLAGTPASAAGRGVSAVKLNPDAAAALRAQGKGVQKDRVEAYLWLSLAAQHGIGTALDALESVVKEMSLEEKNKGAALFDQWRSRTRSTENQVAGIVSTPSKSSRSQ